MKAYRIFGSQNKRSRHSGFFLYVSSEYRRRPGEEAPCSLKISIGKAEAAVRRINLEGNTHAQELNVSQCPV
jgi:hypothetical protein